MNRQATLIMLGLASLSGSGCAQSIDYRLSPPAETQWVNVEIKNPSQYTRPFPLEVVYISHKCLKNRINGFDGTQESKPRYKPIKVELEAQGNDIWRAKVAMTGGGACEWRLSEFNLGIEYIEAKHLGNDLVPGTAVGATIAFDNIAAQDGTFENVVGNSLEYSPKYYPYIREWRLVRNKNELTLLAKKRFSPFRMAGAGNILYSPTIDERKIVRYVEPEKKIDGVRPKIIYPDGSEATKGELLPNFDKVDQMKLK